MATIFSYLRLFIFLGAVLVGIQLPGFVDQYGKSLESHYIESNQNLDEFREDAEKYFEGDIEKLIEHYKKNKDPVFTAGGESINSIYERNILLERAVADFRRGALSAYWQVFLSPVSEIRSEVWNNYTYTVKLDPSAITVGLITGLVFTVISEFVVRGSISLVFLAKRKRQEA